MRLGPRPLASGLPASSEPVHSWLLPQVSSDRQPSLRECEMGQ